MTYSKCVEHDIVEPWTIDVKFALRCLKSLPMYGTAMRSIWSACQRLEQYAQDILCY